MAVDNGKWDSGVGDADAFNPLFNSNKISKKFTSLSVESITAKIPDAPHASAEGNDESNDGEGRGQIDRDCTEINEAAKETDWMKLGINPDVVVGLIKQGKDKAWPSQASILYVVLQLRTSTFATAPFMVGKREAVIVLSCHFAAQRRMIDKKYLSKGAAPSARLQLDPSVILMFPTKLLAVQCENRIRSLAKDAGLDITMQGAYGGAEFPKVEMHRYPQIDILICCPGRLRHMMQMESSGGHGPLLRYDRLKMFATNEVQIEAGPRLDHANNEFAKAVYEKIAAADRNNNQCSIVALSSAMSKTIKEDVNNTLMRYKDPFDTESPLPIDAGISNKLEFYDVKNGNLPRGLMGCIPRSQKADRRFCTLFMAMNDYFQYTIDNEAQRLCSGSLLVVIAKKHDSASIESEMGKAMGQPGPRNKGAMSNVIHGDQSLELMEANAKAFSEGNIPFLYTTPIIGCAGMNWRCMPGVIVHSISANQGDEEGQAGATALNAMSRSGRSGHKGWCGILIDEDNDKDKELAADLVDIYRGLDKLHMIPEFVQNIALAHRRNAGEGEEIADGSEAAGNAWDRTDKAERKAARKAGRSSRGRWR